MKLIAETKGEAFYRGVLAEQIIVDSTRHGGEMNFTDLGQHRCDWVGTVSKEFMGHELHEIPPNGQGLAALIALGILEHLPIKNWPVDSVDSLHVQIEAMKLALADAYRYFADPSSMEVTAEHLLNEEYLNQRSQIIDLSKAQELGHGVPKPSGTVYLTAADQNGMMVSYIQSNYMGFGSGIYTKIIYFFIEAFISSLFILAILSSDIPFGHSTSQAPVFEQFPNPSRSI